MGGKSKSKSTSVSTQRQLSEPIKPLEVRSYYDTVNDLSGGRLNTFATTGTPVTTYNAPTDKQLFDLGGLGATRRRDIERSRMTALDELKADPSLSTFQAQRARQLTNQDAASSIDALDDEIEAAITQIAMQRADREYAADSANARRLREDMALLAEIFFGGKGQRSEGSASSESSSKQSGFSLDNPFSFSFKV